jgi:hypothetical protein
VIGNRAFDNKSNGIFAESEVLISKNVASDNVLSPIVGGRSVGDNLCTGTLC